MQPEISIEKHQGVFVVRDDLMAGGSKRALLPYIATGNDHFVYASPVYGGFQIALAAYCQEIGATATIFCAKRKRRHANTNAALAKGAVIKEVSPGYLSVVEKRAKQFAAITGATKIQFGAKSAQNKRLLKQRVAKALHKLGKEPQEIWCVIGSGLLVESILAATTQAKVCGVQVGAQYNQRHPRLHLYQYHTTFDKPSKVAAPFQSTANYDRKAWEYCIKHKQSNEVLFWNVL
jgi:hypothetical protein